ncbi:unnamed protein product [Rhodiola kirilowii]
MYCRKTGLMSPEIVEIGEDSKMFNAAANNNNISVCCEDVYMVIGKDDLDLVKSMLEQYGSASFRVFLVHVFPPVVRVPTPEYKQWSGGVVSGVCSCDLVLSELFGSESMAGAASMLHLLDIKGRVLVWRDYRGDVSSVQAEKFFAKLNS